MNNIDEIRDLEADLVQAELRPDPAWFERHLHDEVVLDGERQKVRVVAAHQPGGSAKFTRVEMTDAAFVDHGDVVVLTCLGSYETAKGRFTLRFMRVWHRTPTGWRIVAGTTSPA